MTTTTLRAAAAPIALGLLAAAIVSGCHGSTGSPGAAASSDRAAASSASAKAGALASSAAGRDAKTEAADLAAACKAKLGPQGFNAMDPGVPGNKAARKTFYGCEKIPEAKVFSWLICLGGVYAHAPAKGPEGSAAENTRQQAVTVGAGTCTATAKGIRLAAPPTTRPSPTGTRPSPTGTRS